MDDVDDLPVTERPHPATEYIDLKTPKEIVELIGNCEKEIFNGWQEYNGIMDETCLATLDIVSEILTEHLKDEESKMVVFSGSGTSGRLAFLASRLLNMTCQRQDLPGRYRYLINGGSDRNLFGENEKTSGRSEDDATKGSELLSELTNDAKHVLFIGISCGLSAPCVAGQLFHCLQQPAKFTPVLLGFNPITLARTNKIDGLGISFNKVCELLKDAEKSKKAYIINPVIGPETITGSSRMKGGTATKIILDTLGLLTHSRHEATMSSKVNPVTARHWILSMKNACHKLFSECDRIGNIVEAAGQSLMQGGKIYYLADGGQGVMALIDASECVVTYGTGVDDFSAYVECGYSSLHNIEGDLGALGPRYRISIEDFYIDTLHRLTPQDLVVVVCQIDKLIPRKVLMSKAKIALINTIISGQNIVADNSDIELAVDIQLFDCNHTYYLPEQDEMLGELSAKWIFNCISTGANIMCGKVYKNYMINLCISNEKLFWRGISIIMDVTQCSVDVAKTSLLRCIYETDELTEELNNRSASLHLDKLKNKYTVVPTAIVMSVVPGCSYTDAKRRLANGESVRTVIQKQCTN